MAGLISAPDLRASRERFLADDCDAAGAFGFGLFFAVALPPGEVTREAAGEADDGPDSAVSATAVPGLAVIANPTPTANIAEPTRTPKFAEFTLPPVVIQHSKVVAAKCN